MNALAWNYGINSLIVVALCSTAFVGYWPCHFSVRDQPLCFRDFVSLLHFNITNQDFEGLDSINFADYPAYLEWVEITRGMDLPDSATPYCAAG